MGRVIPGQNSQIVLKGNLTRTQQKKNVVDLQSDPNPAKINFVDLHRNAKMICTNKNSAKKFYLPKSDSKSKKIDLQFNTIMKK